MSKQTQEPAAEQDKMVHMRLRVSRKLKMRYVRIAEARTTAHQRVTSADVVREALIKFDPNGKAKAA